MKDTFIKYSIAIAIILIISGMLSILYFYFSIFHYGFSRSNTDWASFGSFFGGVYGTIFSFFSFIAVLYSLNVTQKNNKQQVEFNERQNIFIKDEHATNEFNILIDLLVNKMAEKKFTTHQEKSNEIDLYVNELLMNSRLIFNKDSYPNGFNIMNPIEKNDFFTKWILRTSTKNYNDANKETLKREADILLSIIAVIDRSSETLSPILKTIFLARVNKYYRFVLFIHAKDDGSKLYEKLQPWLMFNELPSLNFIEEMASEFTPPN